MMTPDSDVDLVVSVVALNALALNGVSSVFTVAFNVCRKTRYDSIP